MITKELLKRDNTLRLNNEGKWSNTDLLYSAFNDAGVECEVGELLYGFVRALKPTRILETGTHVGIGALYIGLALECNSRGVLDTIEFLPELHKEAVERIKRARLENRIVCHLMDVKDFQPQDKYQMIFLDTEPQTRFSELVKFWQYLDPGGYLFIHDLHRHMGQVGETEHGLNWPFGSVPEQIKTWIKNDEMRLFHFGTPRGLTGFYKVGGDWKCD